MITLLIVAIVAGLAYPRYQKMVSRSKQAEAKTILQAIFVGQDLYKTANQIYTDDLGMLDVEIPENAKYSYSLSLSEDGASFIGIATANIDGDPVIDEWRIDDTNTLKNTVNDVIEWHEVGQRCDDIILRKWHLFFSISQT